VSILPAASMAQQRLVLQVAALQPHVTVVQGYNFSWLGYPADTTPSSRDFLPGLTAQQQQQDDDGQQQQQGAQPWGTEEGTEEAGEDDEGDDEDDDEGGGVQGAAVGAAGGSSRGVGRGQQQAAWGANGDSSSTASSSSSSSSSSTSTGSSWKSQQVGVLLSAWSHSCCAGPWAADANHFCYQLTKPLLYLVLQCK